MISLLVIKTNQPEKQKTFYENFGLIFQKEKHGKGPEHFSTEIKEQDFVFEIYPLPKSQTIPDTTTRLGFRVDDLEKTIQAIIDLGGKIKTEIRKTPWGTLAVVEDLDGRSIEIYQK